MLYWSFIFSTWASGSGTRGRKKRIVSTSGEDDSEGEPAEAAKGKHPRRDDNAAAATTPDDNNQQLLPVYEEYQHLVETSFDKTAELIASLEAKFTKLEELLEASASSAKTSKPRTTTTTAPSLPTPPSASSATAGKKLKTKKQIREAAQAKVEELLTLLAD